MKHKYLMTLFAMLLALAFNAATARAQSSATVLHYKDVVGTYRDRSRSTFSIDRAPQGMLSINFEGNYEYRMADGGMMANTGVASGTAKLVGDTAIFKPAETTACTLTLVFKPRKLIVKQEGSDADCGFGHHVYADGTYKLISRRVAKFDEYGAPVKKD